MQARSTSLGGAIREEVARERAEEYKAATKAAPSGFTVAEPKCVDSARCAMPSRVAARGVVRCRVFIYLRVSEAAESLFMYVCMYALPYRPVWVH